MNQKDKKIVKGISRRIKVPTVKVLENKSKKVINPTQKKLKEESDCYFQSPHYITTKLY
jgi:hypothetical protein